MHDSCCDSLPMAFTRRQHRPTARCTLSSDQAHLVATVCQQKPKQPRRLGGESPGVPELRSADGGGGGVALMGERVTLICGFFGGSGVR